VHLIESRVTVASLRLGSRKELGEEGSTASNPHPTTQHPVSSIQQPGNEAGPAWK
jgi:hypothetical protein